MSRRLNPQNQALQDRIVEVLADTWPELLTSSEIADRVGGMKTVWSRCWAPEYACRGADDTPWRTNARHHDGPVPQDSWEVRWNAMEMNPPLNRLARDGLVEKIKVQSLRAVLWRWAGDRDDQAERDELVAELEQMLRQGGA